MNRKIARLSWIGSVLALAGVACTCGLFPGAGRSPTATAGGTPPAPQPTETPEAASPSETPSVSTEETESALAYETSMALASQVGAYMTAPEDIPVYEPNTNFSGSVNLVIYSTADDFTEVLDFYKTEMPAQGWTETDTDDTLIRAGSYANLYYTKDDRQANVSLSAMQTEQTVLVMVSIEDTAAQPR